MERLTMREAMRQRGFAAGALGLAFCLAMRDMPQFFAFEALNSIVGTQYLFAAGRGAVFAVVLVLLRPKGGGALLDPASPARFAPVSVAAVCACAGLGIVAFAPGGSWQVAGCFVLGVGQSALIFSWVVHLLRQPRRVMFYLLVSALVAAGAVEMLLAFMQPAAAQAITLAFPVASLVLQASLLREKAGDGKAHAGDAGEGQPLRLCGKTIAVLLTFWGYSFIARQLTDTWMAHGNDENLFLFQVFGGAGTALAAVLVLLIFRLRKPYKTSAVYSAFVVPLLLAALYLSTFLTGLSSILYVTPLFIFRKMILFLAIAGSLSLRPGADRVRFFCWCFLFVEVGNICQTWFFELVKALPVPGDTVSYSVVFVIIALITLSELSSFFTGSIPQATPSQVPSAADLAEEQREQAVVRMQEKFGLTNRETEVLRLLALGRNAEYIAKTLFIAHSTAKSHIAHIYQKTGFNSQQRLMDAIEGHDAEEG